MTGLGELHNRLHGGLWHTTRPNRVPAIIAAGSLLVEPKIDDAERWKTSSGPEYYPFVRIIGGVSLFDFADFDANLYDQKYRLSSWRTFVPYVESWRGAVWFKIDRKTIADQFVSAGELVRRWDTGRYHKHTIMPHIEAAHIGNMPVSALRGAFLTWAGGRQIREFDVVNFDLSNFGQIIHEWKTTFEDT